MIGADSSLSPFVYFYNIATKLNSAASIIKSAIVFKRHANSNLTAADVIVIFYISAASAFNDLNCFIVSEFFEIKTTTIVPFLPSCSSPPLCLFLAIMIYHLQI
jgi:hypothetical protein